MLESCRKVVAHAVPALILFLSLLAIPERCSAQCYATVTPAEAKALVDAGGDLIVIDVREPSEFCAPNANPPVPAGHIAGAKNYPWSSGVLKARYGELPMDRPILVVCLSGSRSRTAAKYLCDQGYTLVTAMSSGMSAWTWETVLCSDIDGDGIVDESDNCPTVSNPDQADADADGIGNACEHVFQRGDFDRNHIVDISDAIRVLLFLFAGGTSPGCEDAADADDNGTLDIADALSILGYLFLSEAPPVGPFEHCGVDPTEDALSCDDGAASCS
jgi:rhodanese-related sulfurtransferase